MMTTVAEIVKAGRFVVPKQMRDALHLVSGTRIPLEQAGESIVIRPEEGLTGGIAYDALLLACARKVDATEFYTFDTNRFRLVAPDLADGIDVQ
ncbi:looped-hinge helix DNA binding domain-containing protein, AbrB family [Granulicella pectinivorans]|uniref:Looped-hinge helix DNA binding domain-containing protein, AbrB family n=1 Tax=Granulicella pectinivorans TaxID=474950 RepID=A0A1I6LL48_9BACT|nr:AbrB/MazE/SpoVT family DNA-binding domain-containing protein [Granulicella pectinivorans]SFS04108.1 looped-hinge helix DNA binding domain-containing protein, AbrB family [Granulicella pectinivorans]